MPDDVGSWDLDEFLDGYRPRTKTVTLYARGDLVDEHDRLEAQLGEASAAGDVDQARGLVDQIKAARAGLEASARTFTVEACPHDEWYQLMADHPPSEDERAKTPQSVVGADFQAHAIARCVTRPTVTVERAKALRARLRPDDFDRLWLAVIECVEGEVTVPKSGLATVVANLFDKQSTPRSNRATRRRSSSAAGGGRSRPTTTTTKAG